MANMEIKHLNIFIIAMLSIYNTSFSQLTDSISILQESFKPAPPEVLYKPDLVYPIIARKGKLEASLYVKIYIGIDGKPVKTEIYKRDPEFVYLFDEEVQRWAMKWEFSPTLDEQGQPIKSKIAVPVRFKYPDFEPPIILEKPEPIYPKDALEMGMEGWIGLGVLIDENGMYEGRPIILARQPVYTNVFDESAIDVAAKSRYSPAKISGSNTSGWLFMKVEFNLSN